MREALALLRESARLYDDPSHGLEDSARRAARSGFRGGAEWMRSAIGVLRGSAPCGSARFTRIGVLKYAACSVAALLPVVLWWGTGSALWLLAVLPSFYVVEASCVFAFPAALDGERRPFAASRALVRRSGGTLGALGRVLVLAATMLFGGLAGRGFVRCWCLGCLAVVIWYERVRSAAPGRVAA